MTNISAFVGHSFSEEDDPVVRAYLDYFDEIQNMGIGFTWDHAKAAETRDLAAKVLNKIQDKNLFIGICTKKERAVDPSDLKPTIFNRARLVGDASKFQWKTSDWIIQEIGLAIGRGMNLMLLIEQDVREPGGLQGNHEFILFDRNAPERSFQQVLETIRSLMPKMAGTSAEVIKPSVEHESGEMEKKEEGTNWLEPKSDWKRHKYEFALMHMILDDNKNGVEKINKAYLASDEAKQPAFCESWEAAHEYFNLTFGKGGTLSKLQRLADTYPDNSEVLRYLAKSYSEYGDHETAAKQFAVAASKAKSKNKEFDRRADIVRSLLKTSKKKEMNDEILRMKILVPQVDDGEAQLIGILRQVAEAEGEDNLYYGLTERLLQLKPDDIDARFSLAYKYSEGDEGDASLYHYLRIPYQERNGAAWNNLGVQYDQFDLVSKSTMAYRKAEELGETLAMSNIAKKLLKVGFLAEAQEICTKALAIKDFHKNIGSTISEIKNIPEEEDKKEKKISGEALPISEFYRDYGRAALQDRLSDQISRWQGADCELEITIKGKSFVAEGRYEQQEGVGLRNALFALAPPGATTRMKKYRVRYEGSVVGRSVKCVLTREVEGEPSASYSLLSGGDKGIDVQMIFSDSLQDIRVYEKRGRKDRKFYLLTRVL